MSLTLWTVQLPMSWLKDEALKNIAYIVVTPEVSHAPMSWSKAEAKVNIPRIVVTPEVSHAPMSSLKDDFNWNKYDMGRPETDHEIRIMAMNVLGTGLYNAGHHEDALPVIEAELALKRRFGASEERLLLVQGNLASTYYKLGHLDKALSMERDIYSGHLKLSGDSHLSTLGAANNYVVSLVRLKHFEEAKSLLRKTTPVSQRALGKSHELTLRMMWAYGQAVYKDPGATLDDLREAVKTLEDAERIARRVFGSAHPAARGIEAFLEESRAALRARETPSPGAA